MGTAASLSDVNSPCRPHRRGMTARTRRRIEQVVGMRWLGSTNREIAAEMFVTVKAVEQMLRQAVERGMRLPPGNKFKQAGEGVSSTPAIQSCDVVNRSLHDQQDHGDSGCNQRSRIREFAQ